MTRRRQLLLQQRLLIPAPILSKGPTGGEVNAGEMTGTAVVIKIAIVDGKKRTIAAHASMSSRRFTAAWTTSVTSSVVSYTARRPKTLALARSKLQSKITATS